MASAHRGERGQASCARSKIGGSQVASDAFGNALGDSIAAANGQKSSGYDDTWHDENMRRIMGLANTDAMSVMSNAGIGAAASRAGSNEGQVLDLIDKELQRVQSLRTGTGTLVDRSSLRSFDAFVREVGDSRAPYGSAMKLLDAGIEALGNRVSANMFWRLSLCREDPSHQSGMLNKSQLAWMSLLEVPVDEFRRRASP